MKASDPVLPNNAFRWKNSPASHVTYDVWLRGILEGQDALASPNVLDPNAVLAADSALTGFGEWGSSRMDGGRSVFEFRTLAGRDGSKGDMFRLGDEINSLLSWLRS